MSWDSYVCTCMRVSLKDMHSNDAITTIIMGSFRPGQSYAPPRKHFLVGASLVPRFSSSLLFPPRFLYCK